MLLVMFSQTYILFRPVRTGIFLKVDPDFRVAADWSISYHYMESSNIDGANGDGAKNSQMGGTRCFYLQIANHPY